MARALDRSLDPAVELARLRQQLRAAYEVAGENLAHNTALQVVKQDGQPLVTLSALPAQDESEFLERVREPLAAALSQVEVTALLREVDACACFARVFTHVADGQPAADLPAVHLCRAAGPGVQRPCFRAKPTAGARRPKTRGALLRPCFGWGVRARAGATCRRI
jgi:hypothetical protein